MRTQKLYYSSMFQRPRGVRFLSPPELVDRPFTMVIALDGRARTHFPSRG